MSERPPSERASPIGTSGSAYRADSQPPPVGVDSVTGSGPAVCDDPDRVAEVIASDDG